MSEKMIVARKSQLHFYVETALFSKADDGQFVLYKPAGKTLGDMRMNESRLPGELYIRRDDKLRGIQEAQKGFNKKLVDNVASGKPEEIKETLVSIVEETLMEPRSGSLEGVSDTVNILLSDYARESDVVKQLLEVSSKDYSTILHSINVMAFALAFASYVGMSESQAKALGIGALLHDVGKTKINQEILIAPRKLTDQEFEEMQSHTTIGYQILRGCTFKDKNIVLAALEHHEKLDGSGYPGKKNRISEVAQILGIIDCYEALTNNDRPYRNAMAPVDALGLLKEDVLKGKFDKQIYEQFIYSLVRKKDSPARVGQTIEKLVTPTPAG
jgi:putative nucleotidyltransferase with HDIG domain